MIRTVFMIILILNGCSSDTDIDLAETIPDVKEVSLCRADGRVYIDILVSEPSEQPTSIAIKVDSLSDGLSSDGESGLIAPGPYGEGLSGLTSSAMGIRHRIEWLHCESDLECTLPPDIVELGGQTECVCVSDVDMFHVLQSMTVLAVNRFEKIDTRTFSDLEVTSPCPVL